ncbi:MAG: hypothetical protein ABSG04_08095 [Verrucomicrobiota bacterium]|jgi:hypothetical protein
MIRRRGTCFALVLLLGLTACQCLKTETSQTVSPAEKSPEGMRFLIQADSLDALLQKARPDLHWTDPDGSAMFLWIQTTNGPGHWTFVMDQAHYLTQRGHSFFAFLDESSAAGLEFLHPLSQFLVLKFVRSPMEFPAGDHGDGNVSFADLLSTNKDGSALFRIVYCSNSGFRAGQEEIKTCLVYISADGQCHLATRDLGHEGAYPHGAIGGRDGFEFQIVWKSRRPAVPFEIRLRAFADTYETGEYSDTRDYTTYQDGLLVGARLPLQAKMSKTRYVEGDGQMTLLSLAGVLTSFYSSWITSDWIPQGQQPKIEAQVMAAWLVELLRLNPSLGVNQTVPKGQSIITIPDEGQVGGAIYERIRPEINPAR